VVVMRRKRERNAVDLAPLVVHYVL